MLSISNIDNRLFAAKLHEKKEIAKDTWQFVFQLEKEMHYIPGQYIWVVLPELVEPDPKGSRRAFSLTSIPSDGKLVSIIFRSGQSGYKKSLLALEIGKEITIIGPGGYSFCLPEDQTTPVVLVAGGVGLSPFLGLLKDSVVKKSSRPITLVNINSSQERCFLIEELKTFQKQNSAITIRNFVGEFTPEVSKDILFGEKTLFYVSGTQSLVDVAHGTLSQRGVFEHQFHFD